MVYFILGILILAHYDPKSIRGTLSSVTMVVLIFSITVLTCLAIFQIFQLPSGFCQLPFAFVWLPGFGGYFQNDIRSRKNKHDA